MPSNAMTYEKSCRGLADGTTKFYQCHTCDNSMQVYMCQYCYRDSNHTNHVVYEVTNYQDIVFCNCGDVTGKLFCSSHKINKSNNIKALPLHFNQNFLDDFCIELNLSTQTGRQLARLNQIKKVWHESHDAELIDRYFIQSNAHAITMFLGKSYSILRKDKEMKFIKKDYYKQTRLLLWHGTKCKNLSGILQNGLRTPTQLGLAKGAMFGNGIYFADRVSKAANYSDQTGEEILLLCEVAVGSMYRTGLSKDYDSPPDDFDSIKGVGKNVPDKEADSIYSNGIVVPLGDTIANKHDGICSSQLQYNEYIIFDPDRILIRFLVLFIRPNLQVFYG